MALSASLFAIEEEEKKPVPIGNFSVPPATQVSPLISFGQLLIGKQVLFPELSGSYTQGRKSSSNLLVPNVIYGILDDLSLALFVPYNLKNRSGPLHSSGVGDLLLQAEYGYYNLTYREAIFQTTVVGAIQFPTGSSIKNPPTGNGSCSYFLGTTFAYLTPNWYAFASPGALITTTRHGTKFGNSYLYQWGFARYIGPLSPPGWVFDLMVEFDGQYVERDRIDGKTDPDSGGNSLFVTPSIWLSSNRWIFQWGIGFPLIQNLNGKQDKSTYSIAYNLGAALQF